MVVFAVQEQRHTSQERTGPRIPTIGMARKAWQRQPHQPRHRPNRSPVTDAEREFLMPMSGPLKVLLEWSREREVRSRRRRLSLSVAISRGSRGLTEIREARKARDPL